MDLETWKRRVRDQLLQSADLFHRSQRDGGYGVLAALTLTPLITAIAGGDYAVFSTVNDIAGDAGAGRIAGQMQKWKDLDASQLAADLQAKVKADPGWLQTLDALTTAVETVRILQEEEVLGDAGRDQFLAALSNELRRLDSSVTVQVSGSGAVAHGPGAVAAGEGGVAVGGNVFGGVHLHGKSGDDREARLDALEQRYLQRLYQRCNTLPLSPLGGDDDSGTEVTLDQVYVALNTTTEVDAGQDEETRLRRTIPSRDEKRLVTALKAAAQQRRLVLLGDPGSGKSTFARQLTAWLATARLGERCAGGMERQSAADHDERARPGATPDRADCR